MKKKLRLRNLKCHERMDSKKKPAMEEFCGVVVFCLFVWGLVGGGGFGVFVFVLWGGLWGGGGVGGGGGFWGVGGVFFCVGGVLVLGGFLGGVWGGGGVGGVLGWGVWFG